MRCVRVRVRTEHTCGRLGDMPSRRDRPQRRSSWALVTFRARPRARRLLASRELQRADAQMQLAADLEVAGAPRHPKALWTLREP